MNDWGTAHPSPDCGFVGKSDLSSGGELEKTLFVFEVGSIYSLLLNADISDICVYIYIYTYIHTYIYIHTYVHTLHYITLHYITLHNIT